MNQPAVFRACYSDWKLVKTRGVVQVIFEVPLAEADLAYKVVGGMPDAAAEKWFAVARLKPESEVRLHNEGQGGHRPVTGSSKPNNTTAAPSILPSEARPATARSWTQLSLANQAGIRCDEPAVWKFLSESYRQQVGSITSKDSAKHAIYSICKVDSRADLVRHTPEGDCWQRLDDQFRAWMHEPEFA